jgi:hypothetical protein
VYTNITRDCIVLQQYDVMIYCQEYGIVTGCKQIVEVVRLSNQAIIKQIKIYYDLNPHAIEKNNIYIDIYRLIPQFYDFSFVWNKQQ